MVIPTSKCIFSRIEWPLLTNANIWCRRTLSSSPSRTTLLREEGKHFFFFCVAVQLGKDFLTFSPFVFQPCPSGRDSFESYCKMFYTFGVPFCLLFDGHSGQTILASSFMWLWSEFIRNLTQNSVTHVVGTTETLNGQRQRRLRRSCIT